MFLNRSLCVRLVKDKELMKWHHQVTVWPEVHQPGLPCSLHSSSLCKGSSPKVTEDVVSPGTACTCRSAETKGLIQYIYYVGHVGVGVVCFAFFLFLETIAVHFCSSRGHSCHMSQERSWLPAMRGILSQRFQLKLSPWHEMFDGIRSLTRKPTGPDRRAPATNRIWPTTSHRSSPCLHQCRTCA